MLNLKYFKVHVIYLDHFINEEDPKREVVCKNTVEKKKSCINVKEISVKSNVSKTHIHSPFSLKYQ